MKCIEHTKVKLNGTNSAAFVVLENTNVGQQCFSFWNGLDLRSRCVIAALPVKHGCNLTEKGRNMDL